jgi:hypothetical protein
VTPSPTPEDRCARLNDGYRPNLTDAAVSKILRDHSWNSTDPTKGLFFEQYSNAASIRRIFNTVLGLRKTPWFLQEGNCKIDVDVSEVFGGPIGWMRANPYTGTRVETATVRLAVKVGKKTVAPPVESMSPFIVNAGY